LEPIKALSIVAVWYIGKSTWYERILKVALSGIEKLVLDRGVM
jgi:hypothetical protein